MQACILGDVGVIRCTSKMIVSIKQLWLCVRYNDFLRSQIVITCILLCNLAMFFTHYTQYSLLLLIHLQVQCDLVITRFYMCSQLSIYQCEIINQIFGCYPLPIDFSCESHSFNHKGPYFYWISGNLEIYCLIYVYIDFIFYHILRRASTFLVNLCIWGFKCMVSLCDWWCQCLNFLQSS